MGNRLVDVAVNRAGKRVAGPAFVGLAHRAETVLRSIVDNTLDGYATVVYRFALWPVAAVWAILNLAFRRRGWR